MTDYYKVDALSASALARLAISPATLRTWLDSQHEQTEDMRLGSAFHSVRDGSFDQKYVIRPTDINARTTEGKTALASLAASGREVLTAEQAAAAYAMSDAVQPLVVDLERGCRREVELFWQRDDLPCKAKLDVLSPMAVVEDYKSTKDVSVHGFKKSIATYRMHIQAAWYLEACQENGIAADIFAWVAVEKNPPYLAKIYQATSDMLETARSEIEWLVKLYKQCRETNNWPGLSARPELISLPRWYHAVGGAT